MERRPWTHGMPRRLLSTVPTEGLPFVPRRRPSVGAGGTVGRPCLNEAGNHLPGLASLRVLNSSGLTFFTDVSPMTTKPPFVGTSFS